MGVVISLFLNRVNMHGLRVLGVKDTLDCQLLEDDYLLPQPVQLDGQASNV